MSTYEIVEPCSFVIDGKAVRFRTVGTVVELDDQTAAQLGTAVHQLGRGTRPDEPPTDTPALGQPVEIIEPTEAVEPEPQLEPTPQPEPEPLPEPVETLKPPRPKPRPPRRPRSEGSDAG